MAKIDRVEDLPEWFKLANYRAAENFGAVEWYEQLAQRQFLITLLECRLNGYDAPDALRKAASENFSRQVKYIRGVSIDKARIPGFFGSASVDQYLEEEKGVHSLTFRHLKEHARNIQHKDPKKWFIEMSEACDEVPYTTETVDQPLFLSGRLTLGERYVSARVDLDIHDSILIESFAMWLTEIRASKGKLEKSKNRYYRPNFKRWANYGLLPYIDLITWEMETGNQVPGRVMAAAILPRLDFGEGNLRKTIAPLAESLLSDLSELRSLAALEAMRQPPELLTNPENFED